MSEQPLSGARAAWKIETPRAGPLLWDGCDAQEGESTQIEPGWDVTAQPAPEYCVDQRVNW